MILFLLPQIRAISSGTMKTTAWQSIRGSNGGLGTSKLRLQHQPAHPVPVLVQALQGHQPVHRLAHQLVRQVVQQQHYNGTTKHS